MSKTLSEQEKNIRKNNANYFKNGKPKKSAMLCKNRFYMAAMKSIYGYYDSNAMCDKRCPLYSTGCDNIGRDWN